MEIESVHDIKKCEKKIDNKNSFLIKSLVTQMLTLSGFVVICPYNKKK